VYVRACDHRNRKKAVEENMVNPSFVVDVVPLASSFIIDNHTMADNNEDSNANNNENNNEAAPEEQPAPEQPAEEEQQPEVAAAAVEQSEREQVLEQYRAKIREHREVEARLKRMREDVKGLVARYEKTEDDLSALQSVGQIIGDVLKRLDKERFIVKASSGPRYVVGCRTRLDHEKLKPGTRVALDMTTLTIMRVLPREVDPTVFHMQSSEEDGGVAFSDIGGLNEQIRELREVIELPLTNPELFIRVGIKVRSFPVECACLVSPVHSSDLHCFSLPLAHHRHPRASYCMDLLERERLCWRVPWHPTLMQPSSRWLLPPLSTSTLVNRLESFAKCLGLLVITSRVSFSWMR
jgi:hypothetical protein